MLTGPLAALAGALLSLLGTQAPVDPQGCHPADEREAMSWSDGGAELLVLDAGNLVPGGTAPAGDDRQCLSDRASDDPRCRLQEPASTPSVPVLDSLDSPPTVATTVPALPMPDTARRPPTRDNARPPHPGYARRVDRPPRS